MDWKRKAGAGLMAAGGICIAAAIGLLWYNQAEDRKAGESAAELLPEIRQEIAVRQSDAEEGLQFYLPAAEEPFLAEESSSQEAAVMIDGYDYLGILTIPALGLELPVMSEWDYTRLRIAPCRYMGSVRTEDLILLAHNYSRHFGRLKNLAVGEDVMFTDLDGNTILYVVAETEIVEPTAIEEMTGSGYPLSLFTCTYGGQTRVTVRCDYKE